MEVVLYVIAGIGLLVAVLLVVSFNKLATMRQLTRNAWSDVDVFLKRRSELLPNLMQTVRGYAQHEQDTFTRTIEARNRALAETSIRGRATAESEVSQGVTKALMLAEAYPDLKASENYLDLQRQLGETEKLIANSRQYYNACVRDYNTLIEAFPSNLVAGVSGFKPADFFEIEQAVQRDAPSLKGLP